MNGTIAADAHPTEDRQVHMVRIAMRENFMAGCELEVKLTPEDAAHFASTIYALAKSAMTMNEESGAASEAVVA